MLQLQPTTKDWYIDDCASTEEWLEKRKEGIGASSLGVLMGLNHYKTPLQMYNEMQGITSPEPAGPAAERGHRMEPVIAADWERLGNIVMHESAHDFLCIDRAKPWRRISPDRFFWPAGTPRSEQTIENSWILECKSYAKFTHKGHKPVHLDDSTVFDAEIGYPYWYAQMQYQMGVCRIGHAVLGYMDMTDTNVPTRFLQVDFNPSYYEFITRDIIDDFWLNHFKTCVPPQQVLSIKDAEARWTRSFDGSVATADAETEKICRTLAEKMAEVKEIEAEADDLKMKVMAVMQMNEKLVGADGRTLATWKTGTRNSLDSTRLKAEKPEIYKSYVNARQSRTFLVKTEA